LQDAYLDDYFENQPVVTKDTVGIVRWESKNLQGYYAPASLFDNKVSFLDMMVKE